MQFTGGVNWTKTNFLIAGGLLFGAGIIIEIIFRKIKIRNYKLVLVSTVLIIVILIWMELAVGILGSLFSGN